VISGLARRTRASVRSSRKASSSPFLQHQTLQREQAVCANAGCETSGLRSHGGGEAGPMLRRAHLT
jgi:hypothetical protein